MSKFRLLSQLMENGRLTWRLMNDKRVPRLIRHGIPLVMFLYLIMPFDFIPDFIPGVGELDDLGVVTLGMSLMVKFAPKYVVDEHKRALGYDVPANGSLADEQSADYWATPAAGKRPGGQPTRPLSARPQKPIDGEYSVRSGDES
ncbi:MAG: YkvA family protein [Chloroflexota bacterium]|nr:YkvA family protein [Chloroflexota bacterium]